ncbi:MAG: Asp/Glu/hydantoin racemase [Phycisphaerales bacterium]|nr:Asp/Glu/hydantoin racemase [Phycisphaerales bacterium]
MSTVFLIHTSASMIPVFKALTTELLPGHQVVNMVDESLLCDIIRDGKCPPLTAKRLANHVLSADEAGADFILVTCSSMGRAVEAASVLSTAPALRVDQPMASKAVSLGSKIGVVATLPSTLAPTVELIRREAAMIGKDITLTDRIVDGAFAAVISGDGATHDKLVGDALRKLAKSVDVIVLAQASMARVVDALPEQDKPKPILSSPRLAIEHLATLVRPDVDSKAGAL